MAQDNKMQERIKLPLVESSQLCMTCTKVEEVRANGLGP